MNSAEKISNILKVDFKPKNSIVRFLFALFRGKESLFEKNPEIQKMKTEENLLVKDSLDIYRQSSIKKKRADTKKLFFLAGELFGHEYLNFIEESENLGRIQLKGTDWDLVEGLAKNSFLLFHRENRLRFSTESIKDKRSLGEVLTSLQNDN